MCRSRVSRLCRSTIMRGATNCVEGLKREREKFCVIRVDSVNILRCRLTRARDGASRCRCRRDNEPSARLPRRCPRRSDRAHDGGSERAIDAHRWRSPCAAQSTQHRVDCLKIFLECVAKWKNYCVVKILGILGFEQLSRRGW